jgi:hypothetical protein
VISVHSPGLDPPAVNVSVPVLWPTKLRALYLPIELFHSEIREKGKEHHIQHQFLSIPIELTRMSRSKFSTCI